MGKQSMEIPTKAQQLAAVIGGTGKSTLKAVARPVLLRVPETDLAELDAMAKMADKSRNAMAVHLLGVALDAVRSELAEEDLQALNEQVFQRFNELQTSTADRESVEA